MLKIGIIGCGKIAQVRHAPEYAENPHCTITACYDFNPERAKTMAAAYGAVAYESLEALLDSGVDAVSVCSANNVHASATVAALRKGIHVLCEKPMAVTLSDCETMVAAQAETGKILMIAHNQRFARAHVAAREMIARGDLGKILSFHTTFGHPGPEGWTGQRNSWFFDKSTAAFGAMADLGIHKTDLIHYLLGEKIQKVSATIATLDKTYPDGTPISVDDNALCLYETESGIRGTMHVSWTFYGQEDNSTRIYGTKGILRIYDDPQYSIIWEKTDGTVERMSLDQMTSNKEQTSGGRTSTGVIDAFIDCIRKGEKPAIDGVEALKAMRVIFTAAQSAQQGCTVSVDHP